MAEFVPFKKSDKFQFYSFIQMPRDFFCIEEYKCLTPNAMVLFSILADRLKMYFAQIDKKSKIQFYDAKGEMYVIFKRDEIQKEIHLNRTALDNAMKLLKDCNLIKEKNQGRNLPNLIYIGKTIDMIENEKIIKFRDVQNGHSRMYETFNPECTKPAPHYNNKYKNNNIYNNTGCQNRKSGYQGRNYPPGYLNKLYANYVPPDNRLEEYKTANGITNLNNLIKNKY